MKMKVSLVIVTLAVVALPVTARAQLQEMRQTIFGMD
jgi:hypothetical protein